MRNDPKFKSPNASTRLSGRAKILIALVVLCLIKVVNSHNTAGLPAKTGEHSKNDVATGDSAEEAAKSAEAAKKNDRGYDEVILAAKGIQTLKAALRDPDSLVVERVYGDIGVACIYYRARNGFGGMNQDTAVFSLLGLSTTRYSWNHLCGPRSLPDITRAAKMTESAMD